MLCRVPRLNLKLRVKRLALLISVLVFAAFLCSCSAQDSNSEQATDAEAVGAAADKVAKTEAQYIVYDSSENVEDLEEVFKAEDLPSVEEAYDITGINAEDAGSSYVDGEILVVVRGGANVDDINSQLAFCEFIQETQLDDEMMITGTIADGKIKKGATGEAVILLHTAEDVQVNQAIAGLKKTKSIHHAEPNYIMTID